VYNSKRHSVQTAGSREADIFRTNEHSFGRVGPKRGEVPHGRHNHCRRERDSGQLSGGLAHQFRGNRTGIAASLL